MKKIVIAIFVSFFCFSSIILGEERDLFSAPTQLPHVKPVMHSPGFWISLHPSPDKIVLTSEQIKTFNENIQENLKLTKDIFSLINHFQTESLLDIFKKTLDDYSQGYYLSNGAQVDENFVDQMRKQMHLRGVVLGIEPRYGLVTSYANQRFLPTKESLFSQKGDADFDELQNSALDVGTVVAVVHQSLDGKWYYVLSSLSDGWVEADKVVIGDTQQIKNYADSKDFVIITSPKADIFLDPSMTNFYEYARMGVKLPLVDENESQYIVQIPLKDQDGQMQLNKGYISKSQAHRGYLPYTARTIYNQAFLMLDKPYGWGDMNGEQDCSRFLQMVFATVGLELPRDSKDQAQVGEEIASFDEKTANKVKLDILQNALGGITILPMKGHIMLYLGMANSIPFVIHETSGYSKTKGDIQIKYVLNRVVVSDLSLGESSSKGSLLRRLSKIVGIK